MNDEVSVTTRRLPVYLLLDCSGSMHGDPIEAVKMGLRQLRSDLQSDPQALESVWLSVITFGNSAQQVVPLTEIGHFQEPKLEASGTTALGEALTLLQSCVDKEVRKTTANQKGDWKPLIFLMTDGQPTDQWEKAADELKKRRPGNIIACAAGSAADDRALKRITDVVVRLQDTSPGTLGAFMKWVTASVSTTSTNVAANPDRAVDLPPLPVDKGIQIVPGRQGNRAANRPLPVLFSGRRVRMSRENALGLRRLPIYLVLDCSGSMAGEPIAAMEMGLKALLGELRNDPQALETVWLSVIAFASTAQQIIPLTDLSEFPSPDLAAAGTTALGEAVELLGQCIEAEVRKTTPEQKGDWRPMVFLLTDGEPTDEWEKPVENFRVRGAATVIACGAGSEVNDATLKRLSDKVVRLRDTQPGTLGAFLKWVTASVSSASQALGARAAAAEQLSDLPKDQGISLMF